MNPLHFVLLEAFDRWNYVTCYAIWSVSSCIHMIQCTTISLNCDLEKHFLKKLCFCSQTTGVPTLWLQSDSIEEVLTTITHPQTSYCNAIKDQHRPLAIETVTAEYGSPHDLVKLFLNTLIYSGKKNIDKLDALPRLVESFCADFVHAVSKGVVTSPKQYFLSLGMHNMKGQKLPI